MCASAHSMSEAQTHSYSSFSIHKRHIWRNAQYDCRMYVMVRHPALCIFAIFLFSGMCCSTAVARCAPADRPFSRTSNRKTDAAHGLRCLPTKAIHEENSARVLSWQRRL